MKTLTPLLIFGLLPPSKSFAATTTVQTACALADSFSVTIVINDIAPPTDRFQSDTVVSVIRLRDLKADADSYKDYKRLYILGDTYESLFALELYQQAPGPIMAPDTRITRLLKSYYECQETWPENYATWLTETLHNEGAIIARALVHHGRFAEEIIREFPDYGGSVTGIQPITAIIRGKDIIGINSLMSTPQVDAAKRETYRQNHRVSDGEILVLWTEGGAAIKAVETLQALNNNAAKKLRFKQVTQTEEHLAELVTAADILLITQDTTECPPMAQLGLALGKAIVTSTQLWAQNLPNNCCIQLPHTGAHHQMVAAIAALAFDHPLRNWYSQNINQNEAKTHIKAQKERVYKCLEKEQVPLEISPIKKIPKSLLPRSKKTLNPGPSRSVALIGAVPPKALVNKLFPEVDWETSPRFATAETKAILCADQPSHADNKLALLGYDSPLIKTRGATHESEGETWPEVRTDLKETAEALCFGCMVEGAISADALIASAKTNYSLHLLFHASDSLKVLTHYEESCGMFWRLDPIRHQIDCMMIAGLGGRYRINLETKNHAIMISDSRQSSAITMDKPATLYADSQGILVFTLSSLNHETFAPQPYQALIKTLAESILNLEWLDHG